MPRFTRNKETARHVSAIFLIYLTLSGEAMRRDYENVASALNAQKADVKQTPEEAEQSFVRKVDALYEHPSMKMSGSGGKLFRFWIGLSEENKAHVSDLMESALDAMGTLYPNDMPCTDGSDASTCSEDDQEALREVDLAVHLEGGITRWFQSQQKKYPERTEYAHCRFNILKIKGQAQSLTVDNMADIVPLALEAEAGETCELAQNFRETLEKKPRWAKFLLGRSSKSSSNVPGDVQQEIGEGDEGSMLEQAMNGTALLDLSAGEMQLSEADSEFWWIFIIILVIVCLFAGSNGPSSSDQRYEAQVYKRGREIASEHNANRGRNGHFMTRRAGRRAARRDLRGY